MAFANATEVAARLRWWVLGIGSVLSIIHALLCWFFAGRLTRPVSELARSAERIKLGHPHQPVRVSEGSTEVNSLADSLNSLFTTLTIREKELKTLTETLERRVNERTLELVLTNDSLLNQVEENKRLQEEQEQLMSNLVKIASTDFLTQTFNRRTLFQVGAEEFRFSRAQGKPLSVIMLDIDDFKQVNDSFDHAAGDEALQKVAQRCRELIRETDTIGRYGGEEFVIVLPDTDANAACAIAERLHQGVTEAGRTMSFSDRLHVTASIGIATATPDVPDFAALVVKADHAHYVAKHSGKNQIAVGQ
jgi:diguanylate cyclase (GGDEF)-like protein